MKHRSDYIEIITRYEEIRDNARRILSPRCKLCKACNGVACSGHHTGFLDFGAKGNGAGFRNSYDALKRIRIELDPIHENYDPDITTDLFGHTFDLPVFASPAGRFIMSTPPESPYYPNNGLYAKALIQGCNKAGGLAWLGDNLSDDYYSEMIEAIGEADGAGIETVKPWADKKKIEWRISECNRNNIIAMAMDLDIIGFGHHLAPVIGPDAHCQTFDVEGLREIIQMAQMPFIVKGIMTPKAAEKAVKAGASGIVVSNHGGNVVEDSRSPVDVLPSIKKAVGNDIKIFADGAVRTGEDVFKLLALGADGVGICRPYIAAVYGGGAEGAYLLTEKLYWELKAIMRMADCKTIRDITPDKVYIESCR